MKKQLGLFLVVLMSVTAPSWAANVTQLLMGIDRANASAPPAGPSRVRVPPGETVTLVLPPEWPGSIQWRKDGEIIPGATGSRLVLGPVTTTNAGFYTVTGAPFPTVSSGIQLDVVVVGSTGNFSTRVRLQPGADTQILGFVVAGKTTKTLLIRAVGPSLAAFGVPDPVARPRIAFFDGEGKEYSWPRVAVVLPPEFWTRLFATAGAFPLSGGEEAYLAYDVASFPPGAYSIQVTDASRKGGNVLIEAYEVP